MKYYSETSRKAKATPMKDAIDAFLKTFSLEKQYNETYIPAYWEKIMGKAIASRTNQLYVRGNTLYLKLDSAPLRNELFMAKTKLIDLLNKEIGEKIIEEVVFL